MTKWQKPTVGSSIYFITSGKIKKATVICHDASFGGFAYEKYFKVQTDDDEVWSVVDYYKTREEAREHIN